MSPRLRRRYRPRCHSPHRRLRLPRTTPPAPRELAPPSPLPTTRQRRRCCYCSQTNCHRLGRKKLLARSNRRAAPGDGHLRITTDRFRSLKIATRASRWPVATRVRRGKALHCRGSRGSSPEPPCLAEAREAPEPCMCSGIGSHDCERRTHTSRQLVTASLTSRAGEHACSR